MCRTMIVSGAFVALGLLAAPLAPAQADDAHKHHEHFMKCAKACADCQVHCDSCFAHCAELVAKGEKNHVETMNTCLGCADCCKLAASLTARHNPFAKEACECCMKCAEACAKACEKFPDDKHMAECAKSCRDCAKACKEMLDHLKH